MGSQLLSSTQMCYLLCTCLSSKAFLCQGIKYVSQQHSTVIFFYMNTNLHIKIWRSKAFSKVRFQVEPIIRSWAGLVTSRWLDLLIDSLEYTPSWLCVDLRKPSGGIKLCKKSTIIDRRNLHLQSLIYIFKFSITTRQEIEIRDEIGS